LVSEAAFLSLVSEGFILILMLRNLRRQNYRIRSLIRTPLDAYILSLVLSDIILPFGAGLNVRWVREERIFCGTYCTAQGTFASVGETSAAMATFVIAVHTFVVIAFRKNPVRMRIPAIVVACIWIYVIAFGVITSGSHAEQGLWYSPVPY